MKHQLVKIITLVITFVLGILFPISDWETYLMMVIGIVISFLAGLSLPYLCLLNLGMGSYKVQLPQWKDAASNIKNPLAFVLLIEYIAYAWGLGLITGELIQNQAANLLGISLIAAGLGMKTGIHLLSKTQNI